MNVSRVVPRLLTAGAGVALGAGMCLLQTIPAGAASSMASPAIAVAPTPGVTGSLPAGTAFYVNPNSAVAKWVAANPSDSREPTIASKIASQPAATWYTTYNPTVIQSQVSSLVTAAAAKGQVPVLVAYEIPNRDCGGASAGGAPSIANYETWISNFAAGLGNATAVVLVEPDSLALQGCLSASDVTARDNAISFAGKTLHADDPHAKVYFDGGHAAWNTPAQQAQALVAAGVTTSADGVFSDVSNFQWTNDEVYYGQQILTAIGDSALHLVIDTSRNGGGPGNTWCDPAGRALGLAPTANTGYSFVDAFLWVKPPGEADGCADPAGTFDPALASALATNPGGGTPSCKVTYTVQSAWATGFTASVTLANTGTAPFGGWTVTWTYPGDQQVTNLWNGFVSQAGETVSAHDAYGTNQTIAPGSSANFGMQGTFSASDATPTTFTMTADNGGTVTCTTG